MFNSFIENCLAILTPDEATRIAYLIGEGVVNSSLDLMPHYNNRHFEGDVDDVRLYTRALSDAEVTELFNIGQE